MIEISPESFRNNSVSNNTSTNNIVDQRIYKIFSDFLTKKFRDHFRASHSCICGEILTNLHNPFKRKIQNPNNP